MTNRLKSPHLQLRLFCSIKKEAESKSKSKSYSPLKALQLMHRRSPRSDSFSLLSAIKSCDPLPLPIIRHLHAHLLKLGFSTHLYVATSLLSVYAAVHFSEARLLFDEMPSRSTVTWNIMITAYSRRGDVRAARLAFDTTPHPNLASWSAMVAAYIDNSLWNHGLALFRLMQHAHAHADADDLRPDQLTLGPILAGCGRLGSAGLPLGKSIHAFAIKNKWDSNVKWTTCLLDMYSKCGLFKNAALLFDTIKDKDRQQALRLFHKMIESGVKPKELTFTGILTACVQAGLVDEGRRYFAMLAQYEVIPRIQHYGCMVDLFGRAGLLDEAYEVVHTMPYKPNVVVWGSFLSSYPVRFVVSPDRAIVVDLLRLE